MRKEGKKQEANKLREMSKELHPSKIPKDQGGQQSTDRSKVDESNQATQREGDEDAEEEDDTKKSESKAIRVVREILQEKEEEMMDRMRVLGDSIEKNLIFRHQNSMAIQQSS